MPICCAPKGDVIPDTDGYKLQPLERPKSPSDGLPPEETPIINKHLRTEDMRKCSQGSLLTTATGLPSSFSTGSINVQTTLREDDRADESCV